MELILHGLGTALMSNFRAIDRETGFLLPPSVDEWLSEKHLARFVVEVIDGLDLSAMVRSYRGSGSASYHPALLLGVLVYESVSDHQIKLQIAKKRTLDLRRPRCQILTSQLLPHHKQAV